MSNDVLFPDVHLFMLVCFCIDGASDPDAEPDERETDGHADCLVQRVSQILWLLLYSGHIGTNSRVRGGTATLFTV